MTLEFKLVDHYIANHDQYGTTVFMIEDVLTICRLLLSLRFIIVRCLLVFKISSVVPS